MREHVQYIIKNFEKRDRENRARSGVEEPYNALDQLLQEVLELINSVLKKKEIIKSEHKSSEKGKVLRESLAQTVFHSHTNQALHPVQSNEPSPYQFQFDEDTHTPNIEYVFDDSSVSAANLDELENPPTDPPTNDKLPREQGEAQLNIQGPSRKRKCRTAQKNLKKTTLKYLEEKNNDKLKVRMKELEIEEKRQQIESEKLELEKQRLAFEKEKFLMEKEERQSLLDLLKTQQALINEVLQKKLQY